MHHLLNDVFRRAGLGPTAKRIWLLILKEPDQSTTEIAIRFGFDRSTALRNLKRLEEYRLSARVGYPPRWSGLDRDLLEVAIELGTAGATEAACQRHNQERRNYQEYLESHRRRTVNAG